MNNVHELRKIRALLTMTFLVVIGSAIQLKSHQQNPPSRPIQFARQGFPKDGDLWMTWDAATRTQYIRAFREGFDRGYLEGCNAAINFFLPNGGLITGSDPTLHCEDVRTSWSRTDDIYVKEITDFYGQYPTDHDIPLLAMMKALSEQSQKTPEQIHQWYISGRSGPLIQ
jgi:hypothetical protein